jgi:pyruvate kinase
MRNTKIVATLGPATDTREAIEKLLDAGTDVFRLNASHGSIEGRAELIRLIRQLESQRGHSVGILLDLQGPKIRLGEFENGGCDLATGSRFTLTTSTCTGSATRASTTYADLAKDVKPGDRILLADGSIELKAVRVNGAEVETEVLTGGWISNRKGINLPGVNVSTPSLTKKDMGDLRTALESGIDMVAMSFVRRGQDMLRLRHFLEEHDAANLPVVAKIEKPEGWANLDEIMEVSDGLMVARGDLGFEMDLEKVPAIQKAMIERARVRGRFVITATQMLESMIESPFPTRAEVSDVANAIFDGTDCVMLSAETSAGKYPVDAVRMMRRIAREAESTLPAWRRSDLTPSAASEPEIVADAAFRACRILGAAAIVVFTSTGSSARLVSRYRPPVPIYAFTHSIAVARQLTAIYGVRAVEVPVLSSTDEMMDQMDSILLDRRLVKAGDRVVFVAGQPIGRPGTTNLMRLHTVT